MEGSLKGMDVALYVSKTVPCTLRRANRLTYLCYSDYLHSTGRRMFDDGIVPTRYGPVVETVRGGFSEYCREMTGKPSDAVSYRLDDTEVLEIPDDLSVLRERILSVPDGREIMDSIDATLRNSVHGE